MRRLAFISIGLLIAAATLAGQTGAPPSAVMSGVVKSGGQPIPGATVTASASDNKKATTTTDEAGRFEFTELAPGSYAFEVRMFGFDTAKKEAALGAPVDFALELAKPPAATARRGPAGFQALQQNQAESATESEVARTPEPPEAEIHARHILLPDEDSAKKALARVKAGEDFAKVAKELSKDPASEGGDLGWFTRERMVPEFSEAAFKLKEGEISEPVKSQFGWHVIQLQGTRTKSFPPFDKVKEQASRFVQQKAQTEMISNLRKDAKIERFDAAPPPAPVATPAPAATPAK